MKHRLYDPYTCSDVTRALQAVELDQPGKCSGVARVTPACVAPACVDPGLSTMKVQNATFTNAGGGTINVTVPTVPGAEYVFTYRVGTGNPIGDAGLRPKLVRQSSPTLTLQGVPTRRIVQTSYHYEIPCKTPVVRSPESNVGRIVT